MIILLTLARVGGAKGYCVCLLAKFQRTYENLHFENTTSRRQIMQGSKATTGFY